MRQAIVSIRDEEFAGVEEVINIYREAEILDVEFLSCDWTGGVLRVRVREELDEQRLAEADSVVWCEQVSNPGSGHVYLIEMTATETSGPKPPETDNVLPTNFLDVGDQEITFDISGSQKGIREVIAGYEKADVNLTLHGLHEYRSRGDVSDSMTKRQREVLQAAYGSGFYEIPRETSMKELAEELGIDGSTVAEHLQRAERNLVSAVLDG